MNPAFEELDYRETPLGPLALRRRRVALLEDLEVYEVMLGDEFLMSSLFHAVEDAVATLGLAELEGRQLDLIVGGLGLGYTARTALQDERVGSLTVVEHLAPVIEWHERGLVPVGPELTRDARCRLLHGDFFALATSEAGFEHGRRFHAVLLDIDHSPTHHLHPSHAGFYTTEGLRALGRHLLPGGVFSMWSNDPPDPAFLELLGTAFTAVRAEVVTFPNPLLDEDSEGTVYLARPADPYQE